MENTLQKKNSASTRIELAQISDTHLLERATDTIHGINPYERLSRICDYVKEKAYDLVIFSGDLADAGLTESYQQLERLIKNITSPILLFAGNHDDPQQLNRAFENRKNCQLAPNKPIIFNNWWLLYVDTVVPGEGHGYIREETVKHLNQQIQKAKDANIALFMHHNPLPTGIPKLDCYSIQNFETMRQEFTSPVKLIGYGHIHQDLTHWDRGIAYAACPSAAFQIHEHGVDTTQYGFKEYVLEKETIRIKPIWFIEEK